MARLTRDDLAMRRSGITATDVAALAGLDPRRGPCDVYADKIADGDGDQADLPADDPREIGHALEPAIISILAHVRGLDIAPGRTVRDSIVRHFLASPDGIVMSAGAPVAVAEAKAVGPSSWHEWDDAPDGIPARTLVQVVWQAARLRVAGGYVAALAGTRALTYYVPRDDGLASALAEMADTWWRNHVIARVPPPPDGTDGAHRMLRAMWPRERGERLRAGPDMEAIARRYWDARERMSAARDEMSRAEHDMQSMLRDAPGVNGDGWSASWSTRRAYTRPAAQVAEARVFSMRRRP